jgi:hypothetical protein
MRDFLHENGWGIIPHYFIFILWEKWMKRFDLCQSARLRRKRASHPVHHHPQDGIGINVAVYVTRMPSSQAFLNPPNQVCFHPPRQAKTRIQDIAGDWGYC